MDDQPTYGHPRSDDSEPAAHVAAVVMMHTDAVHKMFEIGLSIQSQAASMDLSDRLSVLVDELLAALDSTVRAAYGGAFELSPESRATRLSIVNVRPGVI